MRIGFDAKRAFHNSRGLGNYSRTLLEGLVKFYPHHHYFLYTPPFPSAQGEGWREKISPPSSVLEPQGAKAYFPSLWRTFFLGKELSKNKINIYHGLSHELPWGINKIKCKSIVTIHDLIFCRFPQWFSPIDRMIYRQKIKYACKHADLIIAICQQTRRDLEHFLAVPGEKIRVVYQSVGHHFTLPPPRDDHLLQRQAIDRPYILFVGALEERKNVLGLISAYSKTREGEKYSLVLVGDGGEAYRKKIGGLIDQLGLHGRVKIFSGASTSELHALYHHCTLFCYPSFFEGFGLPIAEAAFCGKPIITSTGSCFAEVGGEQTLYIDPHSTDELALGLQEVLESEEKQRQMGLGAKKHGEKFAPAMATAGLMAVYEELF